LVVVSVLGDGHIAVLEVLGFIGPQAAVGQEQHIIMHMFGAPAMVN
jgi:hypothetical protein